MVGSRVTVNVPPLNTNLDLQDGSRFVDADNPLGIRWVDGSKDLT